MAERSLSEPLKSDSFWPRALFIGLGAPLFLLLAAPGFSIFERLSFDAISTQLKERETLQAIWLSLLTSGITMVIAILTGIPLAYYIVNSRSRLSRLVAIFVDLPTVLPPAVAGVALLLVFGRKGWIGQWLDAAGMPIAFTLVAVVLAQLFVAAPFFVKSVVVGIAGVPRELNEAASLDGANWFQTFRSITLPLAWRAVFTGAALCWARALGEFGATMIFAGNFPGRTQTMPLAIYIGFEIELDRALVLAAILLLAALSVLILARMLLKEEV